MGYIIVFFYLFFVYLILTVLKRLFKLSGDITRKIMHIFSCLSIFIINYYYMNQIHMFIIPFLYIILNYLIIKFDLFSIMKRDTKHYGAVYFSITLFISQLYIYIDPTLYKCSCYSLLLLAFGDGASGLFGAIIKRNFRLTKHKSIIGFLSFFVFSFVSLLLVNNKLCMLSIIDLVVLVVTSAVIELLTDNGLDNFTIYFISLLLVKIMVL